MDGENTKDLYRECLRNHAASLGSYATDGCGEFTLDDTSPNSLQCAACGCHRNFHRKVSYCGSSRDGRSQETTTEMIEYGGGGRRDHHHQLMVVVESAEAERMMSNNNNNKRRFRTKFTAEQKEKMLTFAEKLGWKLTRKGVEDEVEKFCKGIGISRQVFKVWMHNHKNSSSSSTSANSTANACSSLTTQ